MNKYMIKLLTTDMGVESYSVIEGSGIESNHFTIQQFLDWLEGMKNSFDYSEDYFHFIPVDAGTEMFCKGDDKLTEVTKQEFNRALLTITMFQDMDNNVSRRPNV